MKLSSLLIFISLGILSLNVFAYGPSIHIREAENYIVMLNENIDYQEVDSEYDPQLLTNNIWELRLGSIWPDLANVAGFANHHDRIIALALLEAAKAVTDETRSWKVAFATGNLMHLTGDLVAQGMMTQRFTTVGNWGAANVFPGIQDDRPDGENELIVEGWLEFAHSAPMKYVEMIWHFILNSAGQQRLRDAYNFYAANWNRQARLTRSSQILSAATLNNKFVILKNTLAKFDKGLMIKNAQERLIYNSAAQGFRNQKSLNSKGLVNQIELNRIKTNIAAVPYFWRKYYDEGYFDLSAYIMMTGFEEGQGYFDNFSNWEEKPFRSSVLQSLNDYLPDQMAQQDNILIKDLKWLDNNGQNITSIDSDNPPSSVNVEITFYNLPTENYENLIAYVALCKNHNCNSTADIVNFDTYSIALDPWIYGDTNPKKITLSYDNFPNYLAAHSDLEKLVVNIGSALYPWLAKPFFTTDFSVYEQITGVDMTAAPYDLYRNNQWPFSLLIE